MNSLHNQDSSVHGRSRPKQIGHSPIRAFAGHQARGRQHGVGVQQLQRVDQAWRQLRSGLRLRPVYHHAAHRIHAHIALTVMALLLERIAEHACGETWRTIRDDLKGIQPVQLMGANGTLWQVTESRANASRRLKSPQIGPPAAVLELR